MNMLPPDPQAMGKDALRTEVVRLRGTLHAIHDMLHADKIEEAHARLHCAVEGGTPSAGNITIDDAARITEFITAFNHMAEAARLNACTVILLPSATKPGHVSVQIGGSVQATQAVRQMMGMQPTQALGMTS